MNRSIPKQTQLKIADILEKYIEMNSIKHTDMIDRSDTSMAARIINKINLK